MPVGARAARAGGRRVGELDEEMVYEARPGEVILLGASAWRIERITPRPRAGQSRARRAGQDPVLEGRRGRPAGRAGAGDRRLHARLRRGRRGAGAPASGGRDAPPGASTTSMSGRPTTSWPTSRRSRRRPAPCRRTGRIVLERFRDELGDWRICLLTPFGGRVHAPWALAIEARLREQLGLEVQPIWSDDGIVIRLARRTGRRIGWIAPERLPRTRSTAPLDLTASEGRPRPRPPCASPRTRSRSSSSASLGRLARCSPAASGRTRRARCCCRAAARACARRCGRCASGPRSSWPWPAATAASRSSWRRTASASRTCSTCPALKALLGAIERREIRVVSVETAARVAVRQLAPLRLHRGLHVRRRRAAGRPPRAGAGARPRPAARAAGRGGAAGAARRRSAGRPRAGAAGPDARAGGHAPRTRSTTCCAASGTCPRTRSRRGSGRRTAPSA